MPQWPEAENAKGRRAAVDALGKIDGAWTPWAFDEPPAQFPCQPVVKIDPGAKAAVPALVAYLNDRDAGVRQAAADALWMIGVNAPAGGSITRRTAGQTENPRFVSRQPVPWREWAENETRS